MERIDFKVPPSPPTFGRWLRPCHFVCYTKLRQTFVNPNQSSLRRHRRPEIVQPAPRRPICTSTTPTGVNWDRRSTIFLYSFEIMWDKINPRITVRHGQLVYISLNVAAPNLNPPDAGCVLCLQTAASLSGPAFPSVNRPFSFVRLLRQRDILNEMES